MICICLLADPLADVPARPESFTCTPSACRDYVLTINGIIPICDMVCSMFMIGMPTLAVFRLSISQKPSGILAFERRKYFILGFVMIFTHDTSTSCCCACGIPPSWSGMMWLCRALSLQKPMSWSGGYGRPPSAFFV